MSVTNAAGTAEDTVQLTVSSLDLPQYTYEPHALYLFRRISRKGDGNRYRYAISTHPENEVKLGGRTYTKAATMGYVYRNDGDYKAPTGSKVITSNGLVFVCISPDGQSESYSGYYAYPMNTDGTLVDSPTVNSDTSDVEDCAIYIDTRNGDVRKGIGGLAIDIEDTHPRIFSNTANRFALLPSTDTKYTDLDVSRVWTLGNDMTYSSKVNSGGRTAGRWKVKDGWTKPAYTDLIWTRQGPNSTGYRSTPSLGGSNKDGSTWYYEASWYFYRPTKTLTATYKEGTKKSNAKVVSWEQLSDLARNNATSEWFKMLGFGDRPEHSDTFIKNWVRVDGEFSPNQTPGAITTSGYEPDDFGGYYRWKLVSSEDWTTTVEPI